MAIAYKRIARLFPLIPVLPPLRPEIIAVKNAISEDELYGLGDLAVDRLKRVTKGILQVGGPFWVAGKRRIFSVQRKNTRRASDVCE